MRRRKRILSELAPRARLYLREVSALLEKTIESKFKKAVEATGARCLKFVSPGFVGVPDRIILLPGGTVFFAELKAPKKTERKRQEYVQGILRNMGFTVFSSVNTDEKILEVTHRCREVVRNVKGF